MMFMEVPLVQLAKTAVRMENSAAAEGGGNEQAWLPKKTINVVKRLGCVVECWVRGMAAEG